MKYQSNNGFFAEKSDKLFVIAPYECLLPDPIQEDDYETFYFDEEGDDAADGRTPERAKRTLAEAGRTAKIHKGAVKLLLKSGGTFKGNLILSKLHTSADKPLIVDKYGGEQLPILEGGRDAVVFIEESNVWVRNLEVTGREALRGIYCCPRKSGAMKNITIENCYVHDVNFQWDFAKSPSSTHPDEFDPEEVCSDHAAIYAENGQTYTRYGRRSHGGIIFLNGTTEQVGASWFDKIYILNNRVENVARTGIYLANVWANRPGVGYGNNKWTGVEHECAVSAEKGIGWFAHHDVVCEGNEVLCAGGDGIILSGVKGASLEENVCYYANYLGRAGYWNAGIWVFDAHDCMFRRNEAAYTYMRHESNDAQGFDIDNACSEVLFEENYSHHNEGGGLLVCNQFTQIMEHSEDGEEITSLKTCGRWYNNIVRNNVFAFNGNLWDKTRAAFLTIARETDYLFAERNTILLRGDIDGQSVIHTEDKSQNCYRNLYRNNLIYAEEKTAASYTVDMMRDSKFSENAYYNVEIASGGEESGKVILDDYSVMRQFELGGYDKVAFFYSTEKYGANIKK